VESALAERGLGSTDSQAKFAWVDLGDHDEAEVMRRLGERGVIVRSGTDLGREGRIRVTYGTRPENDRFLAALDQALAS
jgi:histidinol-phosphate aminotransferase